MSVVEFFVEDSVCSSLSIVQGNLFNGLEYSETLTSGLFFDELAFLFSFDFIEESLDLSESFANDHSPFCICNDGFDLFELFPTTASVYLSAINVLHSPKVSPVRIYWVGLDVIHGPDCFYEECIETVYFYSATMSANLFLESIFDSFFVDLDPPYQTFVDVARIVYVSSSDLLISSDSSLQEYYFNNLCDERFFAFPVAIRGFPVLASDRLGLRDPVILAHTRTIDEALALVEACGSTWSGQETLADVFVSFDGSLSEKYYEHLLAESVAFVVANDAYSELHAIADDVLKGVDNIDSFSTQYYILMESLIASEVSSLIFACFEDAADSVGIDHNALCRQLFVDIVLDSCNVLDSSVLQVSVFEKALDSLVSYDTIEEQHERV